MYTILALDGGGVRGVFSARVLERLDALVPGGILSKVDLFAGTSTGALLAATLARGMPPGAIVNLYQDKGPKIFAARGLLDSITHLDEVWRANFDNTGLKAALEEIFGTDRLSDLPVRILIPTFDLDNLDPESLTTATRRYIYRSWKPKILHNFPGDDSDGGVSIVDALLRTSAAPTYFPSHQGYVDGGVVANNPSMCAVAKAVRQGVPLADIRLISVGTGFNPHYVEGERLDWGYRQWVPNLISMLFDGMVGVPSYQCEQLLGTRYVRVDTAYREVIGLDAVDRIPDLVEIADRVDLTEALGWAF